KVINNTHYNPDTVIDLSKIKFQNQRWNFSEFSVDQLKTWILEDIEKTFVANKIDLKYLDDYGVKPLDDETLQQFIKSENLVSLTITIYSQDDSMKTKGYTTLELINDPDGEIAPPEPPNPDPDPKPLPPDGNSWIAKKTNLIIMSIVAILIISASGIGIFFKYRLKKGIGGKKLKKVKNNQ
ncbi:MAG: Mbov_0399 family ICE element protein, partial [Spiroplasma sp.]